MFKVNQKVALSLITILLLGVFLVSGCAGKADPDTPDSNASDNQLFGSLTIAGSTSVQPFSEVLAEEFMHQNQNVTVNIQGGGSSQGIAAALSGAAQIGSSSRDLKNEETAQGIVPVQIAIDGIALVVNSANPIKALTSEEVKDIFAGNITDWKELGGEDGVITVVTREEASGTRDAFMSIIMGQDNIINSAIVQNSTGAVRTTVAGDKRAIGYISLAKVNSEVAALAIDGVEANEANVLNGTYTLQRPFIYVTKGEPGPLAQAFIDFVLSDQGQSIIAEEGAFRIDR